MTKLEQKREGKENSLRKLQWKLQNEVMTVNEKLDLMKDIDNLKREVFNLNIQIMRGETDEH